MSKISEIEERFERGYTPTLYGTVTDARLQMYSDLEELINEFKKLNIHDVSNASEFEGVCYQEVRYNTRCNEFCGDNDTCGC